MSHAIIPPELEQLATPMAWGDADGVLRGCNPAFARWLGVGRRRLLNLPLASLEAQGERIAAWFAHVDAATAGVTRLQG